MEAKPSRKKANPSKGLVVKRHFSTEGTHPYDAITWQRRDVLQENRNTGEVIFEQRGVEFPEFWSENASTIVTTKYFRGAVGTPERESSLRQIIDRIADTYVNAGKENNYFASEKDADIFSDELKYLLLHQYFAFNSPVWFNVGTSSSQQVSACFLLAVEDDMASILNWYKEEGLIFKGGSGAGINLSNIRSSKELLSSSGGNASGPVSFMRGADASAGTIKSGGATRRAAKMVILDVDHPDIEEFIETKAHEEGKIRVLREAGYDMELGGKDSISVQYQNANNSVRVDDKFMRAVENGGKYDLVARTTGKVLDQVDARELFNKIAQAAWECADPGIQYKDTINSWHTNPNTGPITTSNPCVEFMSVDNASCNLASLNLLKFLNDDNTFAVENFINAVETIITAMDISICFGEFPTEKITQVTKDFRQLGIGVTNLGALLMASGLAYDSDEGRALSAGINSLMSATAYRRSAELASILGPYKGYKVNAAPHTKVVQRHADANEQVRALTDNDQVILSAAKEQWNKSLSLGKKNGWRNAQLSLQAPTGTISFALNAATTGIEPDFSLVKYKKLVGGSSMKIVNDTVHMALTRLGYNYSEVKEIVAYVAEHGHVIEAPYLQEEHYAVFDCAMGARPISPEGHIRMMAAMQPFLSGAISKTVNLPETATVEDIKNVYMEGWKLGLKALAIYRDNCKVGQPLEVATKQKDQELFDPGAVTPMSVRRRLPYKRRGHTTSVSIAGVEGYITTGEYEDGSLGEIFVRMSKQGSTLNGIVDAMAIGVSVGLQYGVPLETFVKKYVNSTFEPSGLTTDPDVRIGKSILDLIFRRLAIDYLAPEVRQVYGVYTLEEREQELEGSHVRELTVVEDVDTTTVDAPMCMTCGESTYMRRSGVCWACEQCGNTTGCS